MPRDEAGPREDESTPAKFPRSLCFSCPWRSRSPDTGHGGRSAILNALEFKPNVISTHPGLRRLLARAQQNRASQAAASADTSAVPGVGQHR